MIHNGNVTSVLDRLYAIAQLRQTLSQHVIVNGQQVGDLVTSQNPWGKTIRGYIVSMDNRLSPSGQTAHIKINGMETDTVENSPL